MNEPRRLSKSGGVSQRLLDSASIDKPTDAARRRAAALTATANSFASTHSGEVTTPASLRPVSTTKTLATWILIGAAASVTLALLASRLLDSKAARDAASQPPPAMSVLAEPAALPSAVPVRASEIASEPPATVHVPPSPPPPSHSAHSGEAAEARAPANDFQTKYPQRPLVQRALRDVPK